MNKALIDALSKPRGACETCKGWSPRGEYVGLCVMGTAPWFGMTVDSKFVCPSYERREGAQLKQY